MHQLSENVKVAIGIFARSQAASTVNGAGIDTNGFSRALVVLNAGTAGASATVDVKIQHSADNSTFADITGAVFTQVTTANDETIYLLDLSLVGVNRYIRVVSVVATATSALGVEVVLYRGAQAPVTQLQTIVRA